MPAAAVAYSDFGGRSGGPPTNLRRTLCTGDPAGRPYEFEMLILSRKPGDAIVIGDGIRVVVLESDRRGVRLGIEAPAEVSILREEIVQAITTENRRANASPETADWLQVLPVRKSGS